MSLMIARELQIFRTGWHVAILCVCDLHRQHDSLIVELAHGSHACAMKIGMITGGVLGQDSSVTGPQTSHMPFSVVTVHVMCGAGMKTPWGWLCSPQAP